MANKRIYYAIQQVRIGQKGVNLTVAHGLQTVGMTTNFTLEQIFEIGQLEIYQNMEEVPEIEVTLNKVLDGYPLLYCLATELGCNKPGDTKSTSPTITGRQNARCDVELAIFPDSKVAASGDALSAGASVVTCSGMYVSSVSYTFPVDGTFTEDVTLVGNDKVWATSGVGAGQFTAPDEPIALSMVNRRQHLDMDACVFPTEIPGCSTGKNAKDSNGEFGAHFQNVSVSCDFGRESINELGRFGPFFRYVTFPVEVTSEFEVSATEGDGINATESGYYKMGGSVATATDTGCVYRYNLANQKIFLQTCEGTKIHLGSKNKLSSVNYAGGDTGGGNVTVTYSYTTYNDFVVAHSGGPQSAASGWYTALTAASY